MAKPIIFWVGATGYLGSEALLLLNDYLPKPNSYHVVALVRNATPERVSELKRLYPDIETLQGTLDDEKIIREAAAQADVVINTGDSLHPGCVHGILAGLTTRAKSNTGAPDPIYVHVSSSTILTDGCNGEHVEPTVWTDKDFDVHTKLEADAVHADTEFPIADAGKRSEHRIRTFVMNPALIYGVGSGVQRNSSWLRFWVDTTKETGYSGLYGEGANALGHVHVRDAATALLTVLNAALEGKIQGGKDANYFVSVSKTGQKNWSEVIGNHMHSKGVIKEAGCRPWPEAVTGTRGSLWWLTFGGNQILSSDRLYALGWEPTETKKQSLIDNLPEAVDALLQSK
ncbi:NAD(P)-binding protein [Coniophora puteana RWD-64-598 SS2]|uniref:NAD(P)-binding protein n=1 Tax=Coniophora puteana (strain RWD-64-598) TaxID=741705 RepID=A0A5M3MWX5_CONPW|nr:NAD(P)-binding protein [Coniophora puteana RWD-64-598 SS2]EIW83626.1 NAD(P)-binding protein [Coniophora puteana RWD-64-598 SS2]